MNPVLMVFNLILLAIRVLVWLIIADAILTWIPQVNRRHPIVVALRRITEPLYKPIHKLLPPEKTGYIDLSPLILIIGPQVLATMLAAIFRAMIIS